MTHLAYAQSLPPTALKVIHHLTAAEGSGPTGKLVQGPNGTLYGVLNDGGSFSQGSIFSIDTAAQFQTLYSFGSSSTPDASPTGAYPSAALIFGPDGNLYGTTLVGGSNLGGTVFKITVAGELTTLVAFGGSPTAEVQPYAPLFLGPDGNFYGTTNAGGNGGTGTVFRMSPSGVVTLLHSFAGDSSEGSGLYGGMIAAADGAVYGTTSLGGFHSAAGDGTVFKIAADQTFSILHYFPYTATNSISGLTAGPDGTFYGTTAFGGTGGDVFTITADGFFTELHKFGCSCGTPDGSEPVGSLTLASDGNFYGITTFGGTSNNGTIFRMTPSGVVTPLHSFAGTDGDSPVGGVIEGADGRFYGMTSGVFTRNPTIYSLALPPSASPTDVAAVAADGAVELSWVAAKSASSYSVYQGTSPGAEGATAVLTGLTTINHKVSGLKNGTTYYFKIVAVNEAGSGPASAEVTVLPIAAPTNLKATGGNSSVSLSWDAAPGAASYSVYEGNAPGGEATGPIATGITSTSFSVIGLANGKAYYFKVVSVNGSTAVASAAEVSATPNAPSMPGASGGGGGGGAVGGIGLVALALLALQRCRVRCRLIR